MDSDETSRQLSQENRAKRAVLCLLYLSITVVLFEHKIDIC